ncbi:polyphosphoinositide phosphatase-like [Montipora foliosa]|uniref:polyphosphoinositide phosphatase-like n=1 Tax=Montipora foliosa TaxID=591990 RepID=UPI0035F188EE
MFSKMADQYSLCCTQRLVLYETKARYFLVGSNNAETRFRVLKIDRTEPYELVVFDDKVEYSQRQIKDLLSMINAGNMPNKNRPYETTNRGLHRSISAYGIVGFVKFLEGYYIILITERRKVAQIGSHSIYKIEDTKLIPIGNEFVKQKIQHPDEAKYVKIFQNVDLSSNFYFSYSYDLTHNLQHQLEPVINPQPDSSSTEGWQAWAACSHFKKGNGDKCQSPGSDKLKANCHKSDELKREGMHDQTSHSDFALSSCQEELKDPRNIVSKQIKSDITTEINEKEEASFEGEKQTAATNLALAGDSNEKTVNEKIDVNTDKCGASPEEVSSLPLVKDNGIPQPQKDLERSNSVHTENVVCAECHKRRQRWEKPFLNKKNSCHKFVWNKYLLQGFEGAVHSDWILHVVNGFVGQSDICVYGRPIYVTLIARRSKEFAGTRFLKRGANDEGSVANEVETEQIVHNASVLSFKSGWFTSYVQLRGSVPSFWSQEVKQVMVPKPQIIVDRADPFCSAAAQHFSQLLRRFGAPVVILNLVKKREKKRHEQILSEELERAVQYLNQFLPAQFAIQYKAWDMARYNKSKGCNVMENLTVIADEVFKATGFFHSGQELHCNQIRRDVRCDGMRGRGYAEGSVGRGQNGVLRTNCVDCLDRTNTAQFMVGKCALGYQLRALGVIDKPFVQFDSDAVRILEDLYEAHGDTLALQYGGSQLVHGIRTYRKVSPFTTHSRDIMQTVSRYYSNAFTDADKQQAMNLFLGIFLPQLEKHKIWELPSDYYLHHNTTWDLKASKKRKSYTKWWDQTVINYLPHPTPLESAPEETDNNEDRATQHSLNTDEEPVDVFSEFYQPDDLTVLESLYPHVMQKSCRDFMPPIAHNHSPFVVRAPAKLTGRRPVPTRRTVGAAPEPLGLYDSSDPGSSSEDDSSAISFMEKSSSSSTCCVSFQELLPSMQDVYGIGLKDPKQQSMGAYERFVQFGKTATRDRERPGVRHIHYNWAAHKPFSLDCSRSVRPPPVDRPSKTLYTAYIQAGKSGQFWTSPVSVEVYRKYVGRKYQ